MFGSLYINVFNVVGLKLYESCISHEQCNGTELAENCTKIENNTICFCQDGYLDFKGTCIKVGLNLNESCVYHEQCNGTENARNCTDIGNNTDKMVRTLIK
uniref:Uncharacterized protein n=1 Tax=Magallana gigas TaxID=29159 RepID=K1QA49_MAGGI